MKNEVGWACSTHGEMRNAYKISISKAEGNRPLRRSRRRWEDNIRMDVRQNLL